MNKVRLPISLDAVFLLENPQFALTFGVTSKPEATRRAIDDLKLVAKRIGEIVQDLSGQAVCSICSAVYTRQRKASEGRGNYCPTCHKDGSKWRVLKRAQRARKKLET